MNEYVLNKIKRSKARGTGDRHYKRTKLSTEKEINELEWQPSQQSIEH